ncbi:MAG TPA: SDR family oxidoreductase [Ensifer sp.]|jgi:NAD(P)-dependent dehydrogenase (short-subunit alcohol dehydrogenase family)|uniref:SDR family oxidoreductase n=1 Tax=Ensifer sp. TaxID=1872086 RepID=UPI002E14A1A7|nr:SDR family oxidoreductase [Ensifer sp.]
MTSSTARRPTVLITGASRGLGAELARIYAADGWRVIACVRGSAPHTGTADRLPLDVADLASIDALGEALQGVAIDVLINNAAVRGDTGGLSTLDTDGFLDVMRINALAPLLVTRALIANLRAGERRVVANISSRAGSLAEGTLDDDDGDYAYRCSKAALNMATVKLAQDLKSDGISVLSLHPGWVQTDMGGSDAVVSVAASAAGLKAIIDKADMAASGSFRAYDGRRVSW